MQREIDKRLSPLSLYSMLSALRLALARNLAARLAYGYTAAGFPFDLAAALIAARQTARAMARQDRQDRQAAFAKRCQAAAAKRQAAAAKRAARKAARNGKLSAKAEKRLAMQRAATLRLKAAEERQRKVRQERQALQMEIGAERIRRAKAAEEKRRLKNNRLTLGQRIVRSHSPTY
jgi:hypothetical protein